MKIEPDLRFAVSIIAVCAVVVGVCVLIDPSGKGIYPTSNGRSVYLAGGSCTIDANLEEMTSAQMRIDLEECIILFEEDVKEGYPDTWRTKIGYFLKYKRLPASSKHFPVEAAKKYAAENLD